MFAQRSLNYYLDALAKREPVPGGGSAAALVAAVGAALSRMVAVYSKAESIPRRLLAKQQRVQRNLIELIDRDTVVFLRLRDAWKLPAETPQRAKLVQRCLCDAADVPLSVCMLCVEALSITAEIAKAGNPRVISDAGCAAYFLEAAFSGAKLNVRVNLKYIVQKQFVKNKKNTLRRLSKDAARFNGRICRMVEKQVG